MGRMIERLLIGMAACGLSPASAQAPQMQPLPVEPGKTFTHKHTRLQFPPELFGMPRTRASALEADELDVSGGYDRRGEAITIYIYRDVSGALPVWFDRAMWAIESQPKAYGTLKRSARPLPFVPPRQSEPAGLIATYAASASPLRSTGVALMPLDGWFVKIRYSSASLDADALDARMRELIAGLNWPKKVRPEPAAVPVAPCAEALTFGEPAQPLPVTAEAAILASFLAMPMDEGKKKKQPQQPAPVVWCRNESVESQSTVYRPDGATDAYLIALSDSGRGVIVGLDPTQVLLEKSGPPAWSVKLQNLSKTLNYQLMDRLPSPTRVAEHINQTQPISVTTTWGKNRDININSDALKGE